MGERNDVQEHLIVDRPLETTSAPFVLPFGFAEEIGPFGPERSPFSIEGLVGSLASELVLAFRRGAGFLGIVVDSIAVDVDLVTAAGDAQHYRTEFDDATPNFRYLAVVSAQATDDELVTLHELVRATVVEDLQRATNLRIAGRMLTSLTT